MKTKSIGPKQDVSTVEVPNKTVESPRDSYQSAPKQIGKIVDFFEGVKSTQFSDQNAFHLTFSLSAEENVNAFFLALKNPQDVRHGQSRFPEVVQLAAMAKDCRLLKMAQETSLAYEKYLREKSDTGELKKRSEECCQYVSTHYPDALAPLHKYYGDVSKHGGDKPDRPSRPSRPDKPDRPEPHSPDRGPSNKDVAAHAVVAAEAVVSAAVWANVAAVTNVSVAAVAVVVVTVV